MEKDPFLLPSGGKARLHARAGGARAAGGRAGFFLEGVAGLEAWQPPGDGEVTGDAERDRLREELAEVVEKHRALNEEHEDLLVMLADQQGGDEGGDEGGGEGDE